MNCAKNYNSCKTPSKLSNAALTWAIALSLCGCATNRQGIAHAIPALTSSDTVVSERFVPVPLPADSLLLTAYLECDSNNAVLLRSLGEQKGHRLASQVAFASGRLTHKVATPFTDTVWVRSETIHVRDLVGQPPVPAKQNRGKEWIAIAITLLLIGYLIRRK